MKILTLSLMLLAPSAMAADLCGNLTKRMTDLPKAGPVFLESWQGPDGGLHPDPALRGAAFIYDNALAALALLACEDKENAARIGDGILNAVLNDRARPGRLRNAYRAGLQAKPAPPHGWWTGDQWAEDSYQVGTSTGNVAWAGIALAQLSKSLDRADYLAGANDLADWAWQMRRNDGFDGGLDGDGEGVRLKWQATEHAIDLYALYSMLGQKDRARVALKFVNSQWDNNHLRTGLTPEGKPNTATSGLDAQLWALLMPGGAKYAPALDYVLDHHGVAGGLDFNDDKDGIWTEGTAQAVLSFAVAGRKDEAERFQTTAFAQLAPNGMLFATDRPEITTGLAIGPNSKSDDFRYYRWPHLGATAWAIMAEKRFNPLR